MKIFREAGQGVVEYALLLGLVAVIVVGITTDKEFFEAFQETFEKVVDQITNYNAVFDTSTPVNDNAWD